MKKIFYLVFILPLFLLSCEKKPEASFYLNSDVFQISQDIVFINNSHNATSYECKGDSVNDLGQPVPSFPSTVNGVTSSHTRPFGYPAVGPNPGPAASYYPSVRLTALGAKVALSATWYLVDVDLLSMSTNSSGQHYSAWSNILSATPVHGTVRNYLYFDGHVGQKKPQANGGD